MLFILDLFKYFNNVISDIDRNIVFILTRFIHLFLLQYIYLYTLFIYGYILTGKIIINGIV